MRTISLLLLSRFCTKSGDNAWFFALPLALVHIYPHTLGPVSLFFLLTRIGVMMLMPWAGRWLDRNSRPLAVYRTVLSQLPLTVALTAVVGLLAARSGESGPFSSLPGVVAFITLVLLGVLSQVGSHLSSVLLTADFIPCLCKDNELTGANTALRRIDLLTETLSPVLAGYVLARFAWQPYVTSGFLIVGVWNFLSFFLEFLVLNHFLNTGVLPKVRNVALHAEEPALALSRWKQFRGELLLFREQVAFFPMLGLACMHIAVLTAPSIVGTSFLKAGWNVSEDVIGLFRGVAAIVSIAATMFVGRAIRAIGLPRSAALFSSLQTLFVVFAAIAFFFGRDAVVFYLGFIVLSRFGHSGYVLCEMQIRQETVPTPQLGLINGIAVSVNSIGSLLILLLGAIFSDTKDFSILVCASTLAIGTCSALGWYWSLRGKGKTLRQVQGYGRRNENRFA